MTTQTSSATATPRAGALDALRGLAILAMVLSSQLPFDQHALPSWMYHAQEPPPHFTWNGNLPGISWVDLVFPFFLFCMGAAFPLALHRRVEAGVSACRWLWSILERGILLGFFALFVMAIRPEQMSHPPTTGTWLLGLLGWLILFPILTRLPAAWPLRVRLAIRGAGWLAAFLFCLLVKYPDGSGFKLERSDIIMVVLTNMAVFGALVWVLTRENLLVRLGLLGFLVAIRLSNTVAGEDNWVHDLWQKSPLPWLYRLYYLQYLCIVIPGTIAGDLILQWLKQTRPVGEIAAPRSWSLFRYLSIGTLMLVLVVALLAGLKARWLPGVSFLAFALCYLGWKLMQQPRNEIETLYQKLFQWSIYWLVLGLLFEPFEGGIKKDHPTLSYYFVTSGLAICAYIGFSIFIDVFQRKRWFWLLVDNGQNPMIAYAGVNNFIAPVLALIPVGEGMSVAQWLAQSVHSPWAGFAVGVLITLLLALCVSFITRMKIYWRT